MDHLHKRIHLGPNEAVEVELKKAANVILLTDSNYRKYKRRDAYHYFGGPARRSPFTIFPPRAGDYELVIDLAGNRGRIEYSYRIVSC